MSLFHISLYLNNPDVYRSQRATTPTATKMAYAGVIVKPISLLGGFTRRVAQDIELPPFPRWHHSWRRQFG